MTNQHLTTQLRETLTWSAERDYAGYDYADGMSSRLRERLPVEHRYLNLAFQETAKRTPVNVRPLLQIPRRRSFKGTGLFISANLTAHEVCEDPEYLQEATRLGRWLLTHRREHPFGWGHNHDLQTLDGVVTRNTPSIVTVTYVLRGLLRLREYGFELPFDPATAVRELLTEELGYTENATGATISYRVGAESSYTVVNANALGAALLVEVADACDAPDLVDLAVPIFEYVAAQQAANGGWYYADPPEASHLSMDSHHNGFVLESFLRYRDVTGETRFDDVIDRGLTFHREVLFEPDGAPNWDERSTYPRDVHAAAQGIVTFARAGDHRFARQILAWTNANLRRSPGRYGYRRGRVINRRFTLMRWCQAWMARAIATLLETAPDRGDIPNRRLREAK